MARRRAFLSYRWSGASDASWVQGLAEDLEQRDIDCILDRSRMSSDDPLETATEFMERGLRAADSVVLVCTPEYAHHANARIGGVGFEASILATETMLRPERAARIVPILRRGRPHASIPTFVPLEHYFDLRRSSPYARTVDELASYLRGLPRFGRDEFEDLPPRRPLRTPRRRVLVAGSGASNDLPSDVRRCAEEVGRLLARLGSGLITCGWQGVDECVVRAYRAALERLEVAGDEYLTQVVLEGEPPSIPFGRLEVVEGFRRSSFDGEIEHDSWTRPIHLADLVILIGGMGGTWTTGEFALQYGKPVLPIGATRRDAREMHRWMCEHWKEVRLEGVRLTEFRRLDGSLPVALSTTASILERWVARTSG